MEAVPLGTRRIPYALVPVGCYESGGRTSNLVTGLGVRVRFTEVVRSLTPWVNLEVGQVFERRLRPSCSSSAREALPKAGLDGSS